MAPPAAKSRTVAASGKKGPRARAAVVPLPSARRRIELLRFAPSGRSLLTGFVVLALAMLPVEARAQVDVYFNMSVDTTLAWPTGNHARGNHVVGGFAAPIAGYGISAPAVVRTCSHNTVAGFTAAFRGCGGTANYGH